MEPTEEIEKLIIPLLEGMNISLVECSIGRHRGDIKVNLVLYKKDGISLENLTEAQKVLRPRLELIYDRDKLSLEISSPGLSRTIKNINEYSIFSGRNIKVLVEENWYSGLLNGIKNNVVTLLIDGRETDFPVNNIRKARLD